MSKGKQPRINEIPAGKNGITDGEQADQDENLMERSGIGGKVGLLGDQLTADGNIFF